MIPAEGRIKQLESELQESSSLARRYRDMYVIERDRARPSTSRQQRNTPRDSEVDNNGNFEGSDNASTKKKGDKKDEGSAGGGGEKKGEKVTEDELDDDQALFKRHVAKIAEMKAMHTTSPIRIEDIIRKSEVRAWWGEAWGNVVVY